MKKINAWGSKSTIETCKHAMTLCLSTRRIAEAIWGKDDVVEVEIRIIKPPHQTKRGKVG